MSRKQNVSRRKKPVSNKRASSIVHCSICTERMKTIDAFKDDTGLVWCENHKKRGTLLNYGKAHEWPEIYFRGQDGTRYAIGAGNDEELWKIAAILGKEAMIDAVIEKIK